jgi:hypothetical protein
VQSLLTNSGKNAALRVHLFGLRPSQHTPFSKYTFTFTERDGRKGPPAGNKAKCHCTNTPHSRATRREAKPNQKPQTHTRGKRQASTTSAEGRARPRIGARPAARVATYAPDRHRDALPWQRATLRSRSAPEMKAARERPGPPAWTAWSAKSPSSVRAGAPRRPKDSTDIGTKGRAEDTCRYARRLEASRAAAANPGARAAPTAKEAAAGWIFEI